MYRCPRGRVSPLRDRRRDSGAGQPVTSPDSEKDLDRYDRVGTWVLAALLIGGLLVWLTYPLWGNG